MCVDIICNLFHEYKYIFFVVYHPVNIILALCFLNNPNLIVITAFHFYTRTQNFSDSYTLYIISLSILNPTPYLFSTHQVRQHFQAEKLHRYHKTLLLRLPLFHCPISLPIPIIFILVTTIPHSSAFKFKLTLLPQRGKCMQSRW